eukprot:7032096-Pyramimonas_sp.AAC.1
MCILKHLPEASGGEKLGPRSLRIGVLSVRDAARRGALRCLIGPAMWPPQRQFEAGSASSNVCTFCDKQVVGSLGHQICDCDPVLDFLPW